MPLLCVMILMSGAALSSAACAATGRHALADAAADLRARASAPVRVDGRPQPAMPASVDLADGLSADEAVAVALWNSPTFQVSVNQLGFVRADLVDAGLLANPTLSLLLPLGPKQLEATLRLPAELLWERPRRLASARLTLDAAGRNLVQTGLDLVQLVRIAYADLALAEDRRTLAESAAAALGRIDTLTAARLRAGDIGELEARAAHVDAVRSAQDAQRTVHDLRIARERLRLLLGIGPDDPALDTLQPGSQGRICGTGAALLTQALGARPDLRGAELTVEAAAARLGWERSRIMTLTAVLDANGQGTQGFEIGPGVDLSLPIFNRNQGGRMRGAAELRRASAAYVALQRQVALEVREAEAQWQQARESRDVWDRDILSPLRANLADADEAFAAGDSSYLFVLENTRRLIEAQVREREIAADEQRAQARLERATGAACPTGEAR